MGMTIAEKIIAAAAGVDSVKPGDIHTVKLDRLMSHFTSPPCSENAIMMVDWISPGLFFIFFICCPVF